MARAKTKDVDTDDRPFITEALDDVHEPKPVAEGEYDLRILKASRETSKKGNDMIAMYIGIEGEDAPPVGMWLLGWDSDTDEQQIKQRKLEMKRFCACFDVPEDFSVGDLVGQTGTSFVIQEEGDDGVMRNRIRLPRLKE